MKFDLAQWKRKLISRSIISTSVTVPGQPSLRFNVEAWLPSRTVKYSIVVLIVILKYSIKRS